MLINAAGLLILYYNSFLFLLKCSHLTVASATLHHLPGAFRATGLLSSTSGTQQALVVIESVTFY